METLALIVLLLPAEPTQAAATGSNQAADAMTVTLDIAHVLNAILWPLVVLVALLVYRKYLPQLVGGLVSRINKLEIAGVSLELAKATPFVPEWSELDLRQKATPMQIMDSTRRSFLAQLTTEGKADYAEINLGTGKEWLTSRLFIMAIVFARMKGIHCFVFLETVGATRRRFAGWAEPSLIRWALAKRYPWLEQAYADAYSTITAQQQAFVVTNQGRLGYQHSLTDPSPSIELLQQFLQRVQASPIPPPGANTADWVSIDPATNTFEHTHWINSENLEELLGEDFHTSAVRAADLKGKRTAEQLREILATPGRYVTVTGAEQRFEYLIDRNILLEQVANIISAETPT